MYDLVLTKALDLGVGSDLCPILCLRFRDSYFRPKIQLRSEFLAHYQLVLLVNLNCDIDFKRDRDARCTLLAREDELFVMKLQPTLGSGMSISAYWAIN